MTDWLESILDINPDTIINNDLKFYMADTDEERHMLERDHDSRREELNFSL